MGPTWGRQDPGGPHVGPMNLAVRDPIVHAEGHDGAGGIQYRMLSVKSNVQATSPYLNQWWFLCWCICVTRPRCVNEYKLKAVWFVSLTVFNSFTENMKIHFVGIFGYVVCVSEGIHWCWWLRFSIRLQCVLFYLCGWFGYLLWPYDVYMYQWTGIILGLLYEPVSIQHCGWLLVMVWCNSNDFSVENYYADWIFFANIVIDLGGDTRALCLMAGCSSFPCKRKDKHNSFWGKMLSGQKLHWHITVMSQWAR